MIDLFRRPIESQRCCGVKSKRTLGTLEYASLYASPRNIYLLYDLQFPLADLEVVETSMEAEMALGSIGNGRNPPGPGNFIRVVRRLAAQGRVFDA